MPSYLVVESVASNGTATATASWSWTVENVPPIPPTTFHRSDGDSMAFPPGPVAQANVQDNNGYAHGGAVSNVYPTNPRRYEAQVITYEGTQSFEPWLDARTISGSADAHQQITLRIEPEPWDTIGDPVRVQLFTTTMITLGGFLRAGTTGSGTGTATYSLGGGHTVVGKLTEGYGESDLVTMDAAVGDTFTITLDASSWYSSTDKDDASDMHASVISQVKLFDPDLSPVDLKVTGQGVPSTVEYQFFVENSNVKQSFDIDFYWATGFNFEDRLGGPVYTVTIPAGPDTTVGVHSGQFDFNQLGNWPPDATHLIMQLDAKDEVREENEYWNDLGAEIPSPSSTLNVIAQFDDEPSPTVFGRYLAGVDLPNKVTVTPVNPAARIAKVKWGVDGMLMFTAAANKNKTEWTFDGNVAKKGRRALAAGAHTLNVVAYDSGGNEVGSFTGEVIVANTLDFELQAAPDPQRKIDDEDLRFLSGIPAKIPFTGTITGLPEFYKSRVQVYVGAARMKPAFDPVQGRTVTFHFEYDASKLKVGPNGSPATTTVKAAIRRSASQKSAGLPVDAVFGDTPEKLTAIGVPSWVKVSKGNRRYDSALGAYKLTDAALKLLAWDAQESDSLPDWIKQALPSNLLQTSVHATPWLDLTVPLDTSEPIGWEGSRVVAGATVFGHTVFDRTYGSNLLDIYGEVNSKTLLPEGFGVKLKQPFSLYDGTLFSVPKVSYPIPGIGFLGSVFNASVGFSLEVLGTVSIQAGVELNWANNSLQYVAADDLVAPTAGTFLQVTGVTTATAIFEAGLSVFSDWLLSVNATGTISPTLTLGAVASFAGPVASLPKPVFRASADFSADVDFVLAGTFLGMSDTLFSLKDDSPEDARFGPYNLFQFNP